MFCSEWVVAWSAEYRDADAEDARLAPYRGLEFFSRSQVDDLVAWKFQGDPRRAARTRQLLGGEKDGTRIELLTRQAFLCTHPYVALLACEALRGVGPAMASTLLMAQNPERYTVIDRRALASLRGLDRFEDGPTYAVSRDWEPYLKSCHEIAHESGCSLRQVDRALYAANGQSGLPGA